MPPTAKRKKTADMPDSPPKRVTRARAKASDNADFKAKTVKVMTPSAKAAVERKKPAELAKTVKRKTRADDERDEPTNEPVQAAPEEAAKPRGRTKKVEQGIVEKAGTAEAPRKPRGRQPKAKVAEMVKAEVPRLRTRANKIQDSEVEVVPFEKPDEKPEPAMKTARTRGTAATTKPSTTSVIPKLTAAPKKKVKFQEDAEKDKENVPIEADKSAPKATGLRAKPIRKPATTKTSTRGKKAAAPKAESNTGSKEDNVLPLSPKKANQIAKSSSIGSEDELCSEKTPTRALSRSPVKPPPSTLRRFDGVPSRLDFNTATVPSPPTKTVLSTVLQSPARRPPQSPFKDALRQSPKKGTIGDPLTQPVLVASQSPLKSTMSDSPKRGLVAQSLMPALPPKTPLKATLLRSPARRPGASPTRNTVTKSAKKEPHCKAHEPAVTPPASPQEACSSPLRAARTPGQLFKVHTISKADCKPASDSPSPEPVPQEVMVPCAPQSPVRVGCPNSTHMDAEENALDVAESTDHDTPEGVQEGRQSGPNETACDSVDPRINIPSNELVFTAPAFSLASAALRCSIDESDSEDELASPQKVFLNAPLLRQGISTEDFRIRSPDLSLHSNKRGTPSVTSKRQSIAMTPLAAQMSAWLASSPEKKTPGAAMVLEQPTSSPLAMSAEVSPPKASFFEDEMAVLDHQDQSILDTQIQDDGHDLMLVQTSQESQVSEEYGDENTMPVNPQLVCVNDIPQGLTLTCTPARVFCSQPREIHTVSKVPLRPADDDSPSPLKVPRKRSKSLTGSLNVASGCHRTLTSTVATLPLSEKVLVSDDMLNHGTCSTPLKHRSGNDDSLIETPRTLPRSTVSNVLKGAVVFVDVHTSEGEDASGIFLELLAQMGARCVKQWSWNPRESLAGAAHGLKLDEDEIAEPEALNNKVGITHVVYKDGGKRTMEKVRASKGAVHCVGVGWVLE